MSALNLEERHAAAGGHLSWRDAAHAGWLTRELVATERGADRLQRWAKAGCPVAVVGDVRLSESGDGIREQIIVALGRVPVPVLHFLAQKCAILGLGIGVGGTACNGTDFGGRILLVVTAGRGDPEEVQTLTGHEVAHGWLHGSDELRDVGSIGEQARSRQARKRLAEESVGLETMRHREDGVTEKVEQEACALVRAWGFGGYAAYHNRRGRR